MRRILGYLCIAGVAGILWQGVPVIAGSMLQDQAAAAGTQQPALPAPDQAQQDEISKQLPAGPGKDTLIRACSGCHLLSVVTVQRKSEADWTDSVITMRSRGANASDDDLAQVVEYLTKNFGPDSPPARVNINTASAVEIAGALSLSADEAAAIVDYRTKNGKFKDVAGVEKVPNVATAKIDAAKDRLDF